MTKPRPGLRRSPAVALLLLAALTPPVRAGSITMLSHAKATPRDRFITVDATFSNRGDEPTQNVQAEIDLHGVRMTSRPHPRLSPGESMSYSFSYDAQGWAPGRYPLVMRTHYADLNGYPFTAVSVTLAELRATGLPDLTAAMSATPVRGRGRVEVRVKNGPTAKNLRVRLVGPDELSFSPAERQIDLAAQGETSLTFESRNFSALPGSAYAVYALLEFDDKGAHQAWVTGTQVRTGKPWPWGQVAGAVAGLVGIAMVVGLLLKIRGRWDPPQRR